MISYTRPNSINTVLRPPSESAQYLAVRYTERLAEAGTVCSVGSRRDSFDNALPETVNGLSSIAPIAAVWRPGAVDRSRTVLPTQPATATM
jgi:hypothetical protein